jgi:hypothetical protein
LSEEGIKQLFQKNRKSIHAGQQKRNAQIDEALYFVIEEKTIR